MLRLPSILARLPRKGVTAVEVALASALVALALVPALNLFPSGMRQAALTEAHVQAQAACEQALDQWIQTALVQSPEAAASGTGGPRQVARGAPGETFSLDVTSGAVEGKPGLWRLAARVEWTPSGVASARTSTLVLERLFCQPHLSLAAEWPLDGGARLPRNAEQTVASLSGPDRLSGSLGLEGGLASLTAH